MNDFSHFVPNQRKILSWSYNKYCFIYDYQIWYGIFNICPIYYVIYQQTSITVQYKINLKCMFKNILYLTLCSLQNQTLDGRIMYLTGTLVGLCHNLIHINNLLQFVCSQVISIKSSYCDYVALKITWHNI